MDQFKLSGKIFWYTLAGVAVAEAVSYVGFRFHTFQLIAFAAVAIATLILSLWRLRYAFYVVCAELIVGSFGYLLWWQVGDFRISIRLAMFLAIFTGWVVFATRNRRFDFQQSGLWKPFLFFLASIVLGVLIGYVRGNDLTNIFFDVNGYLYFGLLFVAAAVVTNWNRIAAVLQVLAAAALMTSMKTVWLLYYFSHQQNENSFRLMYRWVRDT
ncbi:MAG: hypothetical protein V1916_01470, partial [Patescibacteria group bacterium]